MSKDSPEKERKKIDIADLSLNIAEKIAVVNDKEGKMMQKQNSRAKKQIPLDNIKKK